MEVRLALFEQFADFLRWCDQVYVIPRKKSELSFSDVNLSLTLSS